MVGFIGLSLQNNIEALPSKLESISSNYKLTVLKALKCYCLGESIDIDYQEFKHRYEMETKNLGLTEMYLKSVLMGGVVEQMWEYWI